MNNLDFNTMQRVLDLLDERGMNMNQLSKMSGVPISTLRKAKERGGQFSLDTVGRICNALEITYGEFFKDSAFSCSDAESA